MPSAKNMEGGLIRTSLFDSHVSAGAKMVDFHGYELPIWYSSIQEEHMQTRRSAGLFDVSHMGLFRFRGEGVRSWLSEVSTQNYMKFQPGRCGYCHFLDYDGKIIDDMIFAISSESEVLGVPNSTMVSVMLNWLSALLPEDNSISIENMSEKTSIIALQGPQSSNVIGEVLGSENAIGRFTCQEIMDNELGISGWIQGTGYTGEEGVEIFLTNDKSSALWEALSSNSSVTPVGLGARDTLRMEKGYLLSGQDFLWPGLEKEIDGLPEGFLSRSTIETAVPYGLEISHDFIGKSALIESGRSGTRLWGAKCMERGPSPRTGHPVFNGPGEDAEIVGFVTSGGPSPSLEMSGIALCYLDNCEEGGEVWIQSSSRRRVRSLLKKGPFL